MLFIFFGGLIKKDNLINQTQSIMNTQIKIVLFWLKANFEQLFILFCLIFFFAQIVRYLFA